MQRRRAFRRAINTRCRRCGSRGCVVKKRGFRSDRLLAAAKQPVIFYQGHLLRRPANRAGLAVSARHRFGRPRPPGPTQVPLDWHSHLPSGAPTPPPPLRARGRPRSEWPSHGAAHCVTIEPCQQQTSVRCWPQHYVDWTPACGATSCGTLLIMRLMRNSGSRHLIDLLNCIAHALAKGGAAVFDQPQGCIAAQLGTHHHLV